VFWLEPTTPSARSARDVRPADERPDRRWTFEELHRAYGRDLRRFVNRRVRDPELTSDIVQETFLRAYRARGEFDHSRPAWPWLATIARNLTLNALRDEHRRRRFVDPVIGWDEAAAAADQRSEADPERNYAAAQHRAAIANAIVSLSPRPRRVLLLRVAEEMSYDDIAAREGISIDAVKSLLKRARQAFRETYRSLERDRPQPPFAGETSRLP
jgi:RNA polymerase sigma-70 factor (ECF subfamily)